jgi:hypothetical protein
MKTLTLVVDERELSTIRAALLLLQEQVDALPEDLAEMITAHGKAMTVSEIEHLGLRISGAKGLLPDYPQPAYSPLDRAVEVERFSGVAGSQSPA